MGSSKTVQILLVTANVGSIFEDPEQMLKIWTEEFLSTVTRLDPKFVALHCQEVGGKNYEKSMKHVEDFVHLLVSSNELRLFDKINVFLDEDYSSAENFTALGNLYFIHESIKDVLIWNFKDMKFIPVHGKVIHSGSIESVVTKEKAKFPQDFFPECKWSRKGFLRTRWSLDGTVFDMVNIHLFHDASNFIAMESFPSVYCRNRRRALDYTLQRFHNDSYGKAPYFIFGDFNFRTDTDGVIKKLTEGLTSTRVQNNKNGDCTKLQFTDDNSRLILTVGKKEFNHFNHQTVFLNDMDSCWLKEFDKEVKAFENHITEFGVTFSPTYPFEEKITQGSQYMLTRCPSWCDRVLLSHTARQLVSEKDKIEYGLIGNNTCMGDHKPVYLRIDLITNAGTIQCCSHAPYECLPVLCHCCQSYASVTINVIDMSDYFNTRKSFDNITVDSNFLHEPITRDMLMHEPYTPETIESHSPSIEKAESLEVQPVKKRNSISPHELKTKLEDILRIENAKSKKFLMKRSASQHVINNKSPEDDYFRDRSMSENPRKSRVRLKSDSSIATSVNRLQSHHSSSDEDWFEFDENEVPSSLQITKTSVAKKNTDIENRYLQTDIKNVYKNGRKLRHRRFNKVNCCSIL